MEPKHASGIDPRAGLAPHQSRFARAPIVLIACAAASLAAPGTTLARDAAGAPESLAVRVQPASAGGACANLELPAFEKRAEPIMKPRDHGFDSRNIYNMATIRQDGVTSMLYRGEDGSEPAGACTGRIGLATSRDGIHWDREDQPVLVPEHDYERRGIEDPRLVMIEGTYYLTYTGYDGDKARLCLATSPDLHHWTKLGPLFPGFPATGDWTKSGAILPERVKSGLYKDRYVMYFGDTSIWMAFSDDLLHWTPLMNPVITTRQDFFDNDLVESGPPPFLTKDGILMIYNSKSNHGDYSGYNVGAVLFDAGDPTRIIARTEKPLLSPTQDWEQHGYIDNVVFAEGLAVQSGQLFLYYGGADRYIGLAVAPLGQPQVQPGGLDLVKRFASAVELSDAHAMASLAQCLPNTLQTTVRPRPDGTTFVITGDIPAMWVRDSCAQVHPYVYLARDNASLQSTIAGIILRHVRHFNSDGKDAPFINSWKDDGTPWELKYEPDGVAYLIRLAYLYTKVTGDTSWARRAGDLDARKAFDRAVDLVEASLGPAGMVRCTHRPSDDATSRPYLVPTNMFLAAQLPHLAELYANVWNDAARAMTCGALAERIRTGIESHGTVVHPVHGKMYAYEVDDAGAVTLMDDANVPSLLSAPYLEYCPVADPTYRNTRQFVLSKDNPYFFTGAHGQGVGSPHTPGKKVWPMAIMMRALTAYDPAEVTQAIGWLDDLDAGTHFIHESVNPDDPHDYTRSWFAWANSLYGELMMKKVLGLAFEPDDGTYVKPDLGPVRLKEAVPFGDIAALRLDVTGTGPAIVLATVNGQGVPTSDERGIRIAKDPARIVVKLASPSRR